MTGFCHAVSDLQLYLLCHHPKYFINFGSERRLPSKTGAKIHNDGLRCSRRHSWNSPKWLVKTICLRPPLTAHEILSNIYGHISLSLQKLFPKQMATRASLVVGVQSCFWEECSNVPPSKDFSKSITYISFPECD